MNTTKSWVCYLWLLTIESLEQLLDFASTHNPVFAMRMRLRGSAQADEEDTRSPAASRRRVVETTGIYG